MLMEKMRLEVTHEDLHKQSDLLTTVPLYGKLVTIAKCRCNEVNLVKLA